MSTSTNTKHKKDRSKKQKSSSYKSVAIIDEDKNEGVDQSWAFQPPEGTKHISTNAGVDNGEFDWDAVEQDEDVELWVLRVPDNVRPKHLEGLSFDLPSSPSSSKKGKDKTTRIGTLERKHTSYDIWLLGESDAPEGGQPPPVGGEEVKSLSCLLPRKSKKGNLYLAPKPIARHIIVSAQPPKPSTSDSSSNKTPLKNPPRHKYPPELLKHKFTPYGSLVGAQARHSTSDEDVAMIEEGGNVPLEVEKGVRKIDKVEKMQVDAAGEGNIVEKENEKKKSKKRKGGDSQEEVEVVTKKSKKSKTAPA